MLKKKRNQIFQGFAGRESLMDFIWESGDKGLVIFAHGYKGFKDWGAWELMGEAFAKEGYLFQKFNFSHNGGTVSEPIDFPDLDAYSKNTFTKEIFDLKVVLNEGIEFYIQQFGSEPEEVVLIGHSRGGGISILVAEQEKRIDYLVTLASVSDLSQSFPSGEILEKWKRTGVWQVLNSRTKQLLPHHIDFFMDFQANKKRLKVLEAADRLNIPHLIIHAADDLAVPFSAAENIHSHSPFSSLYQLSAGGHTFGIHHPWNEGELSDEMSLLTNKIIEFIYSV